MGQWEDLGSVHPNKTRQVLHLQGACDRKPLLCRLLHNTRRIFLLQSPLVKIQLKLGNSSNMKGCWKINTQSDHILYKILYHKSCGIQAQGSYLDKGVVGSIVSTPVRPALRSGPAKNSHHQEEPHCIGEAERQRHKDPFTNQVEN